MFFFFAVRKNSRILITDKFEFLMPKWLVIRPCGNDLSDLIDSEETLLNIRVNSILVSNGLPLKKSIIVYCPIAE